MHLYIVEPSAVPGNWEWMRSLLSKAIAHDPDRTEERVYSDLCQGRYGALIVRDGAEGVIITANNHPQFRVCYVGGSIGRPLRKNIELLVSVLEAVAGQFDCREIAITGRLGWGRFLAPLGYVRLEDEGGNARFRKELKC